MENIRPIKTEDDYNWAIAEITHYFDNQPLPGTLDGDRFDVLATLVQSYEDEHYPINAPDPVSTIQAHMEMAGLSQKALAEVFGSSPRASEVMARKRALTMDMVFKLHQQWHIPAEALIQPYHLSNKR